MRSRLLIALSVVATLVFPIAAIVAQTPAIVPDQVQEDWQLVIGTPDIVGVGPQITTSMSPVSDNSTPFTAFDMNYREFPSFQAGGMQIQVWSGNDVLDTATEKTEQFSTPGETITWTQSMSIGQDGTVTYRVMNGQSTTWGNFGLNAQHLTVTFPTAINSLSGYSPTTSVNNSGASWESNYVTQLTLVQVRYYAGGRLISTDTTTRSLIPAPSGN
jgi:hypothetical protein